MRIVSVGQMAAQAPQPTHFESSATGCITTELPDGIMVMAS